MYDMEEDMRKDSFEYEVEQMSKEMIEMFDWKDIVEAMDYYYDYAVVEALKEFEDGRSRHHFLLNYICIVNKDTREMFDIELMKEYFEKESKLEE